MFAGHGLYAARKVSIIQLAAREGNQRGRNQALRSFRVRIGFRTTAVTVALGRVRFKAEAHPSGCD